MAIKGSIYLESVEFTQIIIKVSGFARVYNQRQQGT